MRIRSESVPQKLYFRIGEAADLVGVKPYVLRYWETEFNLIRPEKSKSGQRVYRRDDVLLVLLIQSLLYEERLTIEGARKRLKDLKKSGELRAILAGERVALSESAGASTQEQFDRSPEGSPELRRQIAGIAQDLFALARRPISEIFGFTPARLAVSGSDDESASPALG